ncbi:hypothetical protein PC39_12264 [Salinisphaera sp. PC39]
MTLARVLGPVALLAWTAGAAAQGPATLESLEERELDLDRGTAAETRPVDLETARDNYRRLLELTDRPDVRLKVKRRLADLELEVAVEAVDPKPGARRAIELYREVLASSRATERRGELLYNVARASELAGDTAGAITALGRLIEEHPRSELVPEARFRRAEMRFILSNYARAAEDYAWLAERGTDTPFYTQALYKLGWARYRLGEHRASLERLSTALRRKLPPARLDAAGRADLDGLKTADSELVTDTLRAITLNFAQLGDGLTPAAFIDTHADMAPYEFLLYDNLFAHYMDKERYTDASDTALAFAERNPEHPEAKDFEIAAITALEDGGFRSVALERKQGFVRHYGLEGETWYGQDPLAVPEVRERLNEYLDEITRTYHAAAQDTGEADDYRRAAAWYDNYLTVFPDTDDAPTLAYRRASTLYEAGDHAEAARVFERVAYEMPPNTHATEAAYAAVLAWREAAGEENVAGDPKVREATLRLAEAYPAEPEATRALARLAEDLYRADKLQAADDIARRVIAHEPPAEDTQLANAWRIRSAAAMAAEDYETAETAFSWLLEHEPDAKDAPAWREALATAIYRQGEALAEAGRDAEAADEFLRLGETVVGDAPALAEIRTTAAFDAAAAAVRADQTSRAIALYAAFRERYPEHELAPEATRRLAALHLEAGDKARAATEFARVRGQQDIDAEQRRDAALQAARLYEESDDTDAAIDAYETFLEAHDPPFGDRIEAIRSLIALNAAVGDKAAADRWRERLIAADADAGDARTERSRTLAAEATLALAEDKRAAVAEARLTLPIKRSLPAKKERLEAALNAYGKAADYAIAEVTTAATYRIGQLYYEFSRDLLEAPRPPDLSGTEAAQYEILLEEQAFPFEEKAIEIHEANLDRIADGVYNEWIRKSLEQLATLQPARYDREERLDDDIAQLP